MQRTGHLSQPSSNANCQRPRYEYCPRMNYVNSQAASPCHLLRQLSFSEKTRPSFLFRSSLEDQRTVEQSGGVRLDDGTFF